MRKNEKKSTRSSDSFEEKTCKEQGIDYSAKKPTPHEQIFFGIKLVAAVVLFILLLLLLDKIAVL